VHPCRLSEATGSIPEVSTMSEFKKTKISFALALLGTLFALHPFMEPIQEVGFHYLVPGAVFFLKVQYAYVLTAALLAVTVYGYAVALLSDRPSSWMERLGNTAYALAVWVAPLYGGLYLVSLGAEAVEQSDLAWAAPSLALVVGLIWLLVAQLFALALRRRLSQEDRASKVEQLAYHEITALNRAREMFLGEHYDLSVIEAWKAIEARLRRVLLARRYHPSAGRSQELMNLAHRAGLVDGQQLKQLGQLQLHVRVAVSTDPVSKEAADAALASARSILSTVEMNQR
jgi:hypothetical protein